MIVTINTDKMELTIEKATMQELYEYVAKFNLLDYTIVTAVTDIKCDIDKALKFTIT